MTAPELLRARARSYFDDSVVLANSSDRDGAVMYRTIASELRKVADELEADQ